MAPKPHFAAEQAPASPTGLPGAPPPKQESAYASAPDPHLYTGLVDVEGAGRLSTRVNYLSSASQGLAEVNNQD